VCQSEAHSRGKRLACYAPPLSTMRWWRLDADGRPQFNTLLFRRGVPVFVAFDLLALDGRDVRAFPLLRRKALLRRMVPPDSSCVLYAEHIVGAGCALYTDVCARDLEGVVAKHAHALYAEPATWIKIKNREWTSARDRHTPVRLRAL